MIEKNKNILVLISFLFFSLILADPPNWDSDGDGVIDNYSDYANSGSITASVSINNLEVSQLGDMVGAFVNEELRGLALAEEVPEALGGGYSFNILVYSNESDSEMITFKFYYSSIDLIIDLNESIEFVSDMIIGNVIFPQLLSGDFEESYGCNDINACNYDINANINDDSCEYSEQNFDCDGSCVANVDCSGECGGSAALDECGVCDGDGSSCCIFIENVTTGWYHSLGLKSDGTVVAWGGSQNIGDTSMVYGESDVPSDLSNVISVSAGTYHSLALKSDGTVVAWGRNNNGQTDVPIDLLEVIAISGGDKHSLALKSDGTVVAWGTDSDEIPSDLSDVISIATSGEHSLALKSDSTVVAWGDNDWNQSDVPDDLSNVIAIAAGDLHSLALKSDGTVVGWGIDIYGGTPPEDLTDVIAIEAGYRHSVALKSDGTVVAWGNNVFGGLDIPADLENVVSISSRYNHGLAIKSDGEVTGWGGNYQGQLDVPVFCDCFGNLDDCAGICGGQAIEDECGVCDGSGIVDGACDCLGNIYDCDSVCGGTAIEDDCGLCVEGNTGFDACLSISYTIPINVGANLVSFYALPVERDISNILYPNNQDFIFSILGEASNAINNGDNNWIGSLQEFEFDNGYWIRSLNSTDIIINDSYETEFQVYNLHEGANLISYPSNSSILLEDALPDSLENYFVSILGESVSAIKLDDGSWTGSLNYFEPGNAYWFIVNDAFEFSYNLDEILPRNFTVNSPDILHNQSSNQSFYYLNNLDQLELNENDWILAFNNDIIVGSKLMNDFRNDLPVMGDDSFNYSLGYCLYGDTPTFKVLKADNSIIELYGDIPKWKNMEVFEISLFYDLNEVNTPLLIDLVSMYPNPFNPTINIDFNTNITSNITIEIFDLNGRLVNTVLDKQLHEGYHSFPWNANDYNSGVYFAKINSSFSSIVRKITLIK